MSSLLQVLDVQCVFVFTLVFPDQHKYYLLKLACFLAFDWLFGWACPCLFFCVFPKLSMCWVCFNVFADICFLFRSVFCFGLLLLAFTCCCLLLRLRLLAFACCCLLFRHCRWPRYKQEYHFAVAGVPDTIGMPVCRRRCPRYKLEHHVATAGSPDASRNTTSPPQVPQTQAGITFHRRCSRYKQESSFTTAGAPETSKKITSPPLVSPIQARIPFRHRRCPRYKQECHFACKCPTDKQEYHFTTAGAPDRSRNTISPPPVPQILAEIPRYRRRRPRYK